MTVLLLVACGVLLAVFFGALQARWFARMDRGFLFTMILAMGGFVLVSAVVSGFLSYRAGREVVYREIVDGLSNAGDIVEANLRELTRAELEQLHIYADSLAAEMADAKRGQLRADLTHIDELDKVILQISVFDKHTTMLATSYEVKEDDNTSLVAVATALGGNDYVSDPHMSPVIRTYELTMATPIRGPDKSVIAALTIRYDLGTNLSRLIGATRFGGEGYALITDNSGHVLAHVEKQLIGSDLSANPAFQEGTRGTGWRVAPNPRGQRSLFVYRPVKSPASGTPLPWVLLVEMDEEKALAPIAALRRQVLLAIAILTLPGLLIGWRVAVSISGPVEKLVHFVRKVQGGDFTGSVPEGRDELGRLGAALNHMTHGLEERDRVKELFGRYVATQVSDKLVKGEINLGGESRRVTILFSDIRSFTAMSEKMTPAQIVAFLNDYFSEMVEAVFDQSGILDKFMGDGLMAVFGSLGDMPDHPRRAVLTALRMKSLLGKINGDRSMLGKPPIDIGIGLHTDEVIVGNIGSRRRLEYTVIGDGVNTCSRVQALNKDFGTTILITETTYEAVKDEFECRLMPETELRGKSHPLRFYEVVSVKETVGQAVPPVKLNL